METDINVPKSKSVNIFFQFTKMYGYILAVIFVA